MEPLGSIPAVFYSFPDDPASPEDTEVEDDFGATSTSGFGTTSRRQIFAHQMPPARKITGITTRSVFGGSKYAQMNDRTVTGVTYQSTWVIVILLFFVSLSRKIPPRSIPTCRATPVCFAKNAAITHRAHHYYVPRSLSQTPHNAYSIRNLKQWVNARKPNDSTPCKTCYDSSPIDCAATQCAGCGACSARCGHSSHTSRETSSARRALRTPC